MVGSSCHSSFLRYNIREHHYLILNHMRILSRILFIIICTTTFMVVFTVTMARGFRAAIKERNQPILVDYNNEEVVFYDIKYSDSEHCDYDLYIPYKHTDKRNYSLILFIHGGSFTSGDKKEGAPWCRYYASKGRVAASVNYTLHSTGKPSNINTMNYDIVNCVKNIKEVCDSLGYNVDEMATTGISAGGCLAMLYAYREAENSVIPVKFVFQQTGPTSFHGEHWGADNDSAKIALASTLLGIKLNDSIIENGDYIRMIDEISPASHINPNSVPTLCAYGPNDKIVPTNQKFILFDSLETHGVPYVYVEFPHSGHALANDPDSMAVYVKHANLFCDKYFKNKTE